MGGYLYVDFVKESNMEYINKHYDLSLQMSKMKCDYSDCNEQCIRQRCPFYKKKFERTNNNNERTTLI